MIMNPIPSSSSWKTTTNYKRKMQAYRQANRETTTDATADEFSSIVSNNNSRIHYHNKNNKNNKKNNQPTIMMTARIRRQRPRPRPLLVLINALLLVLIITVAMTTTNSCSCCSFFVVVDAFIMTALSPRWSSCHHYHHSRRERIRRISDDDPITQKRPTTTTPTQLHAMMILPHHDAFVDLNLNLHHFPFDLNVHLNLNLNSIHHFNFNINNFFSVPTANAAEMSDKVATTSATASTVSTTTTVPHLFGKIMPSTVKPASLKQTLDLQASTSNVPTVLLLKDYAPQATNLFNNMKLPASVVTAGMISLGFATSFPELPRDTSERIYSPELRDRCDSLRRLHIVVALISVTSMLIVVMWAAVEVNQLTERLFEPTLSVWELLQKECDLAWSAVNTHFVIGIIGFVAMLSIRAYVMLLSASASNELMISASSGTLAGLLLIISIVNRGVEYGGGGDGVKLYRYGSTVGDLFSHYAQLLYINAINQNDPGPLQFSAILLELISLLYALNVWLFDNGKMKLSGVHGITYDDSDNTTTITTTEDINNNNVIDTVVNGDTTNVVDSNNNVFTIEDYNDDEDDDDDNDGDDDDDESCPVIDIDGMNIYSLQINGKGQGTNKEGDTMTGHSTNNSNTAAAPYFCDTDDTTKIITTNNAPSSSSSPQSLTEKEKILLSKCLQLKKEEKQEKKRRHRLSNYELVLEEEEDNDRRRNEDDNHDSSVSIL